jgi:hypothetical protein
MIVCSRKVGYRIEVSHRLHCSKKELLLILIQLQATNNLCTLQGKGHFSWWKMLPNFVFIFIFVWCVVSLDCSCCFTCLLEPKHSYISLVTADRKKHSSNVNHIISTSFYYEYHHTDANVYQCEKWKMDICTLFLSCSLWEKLPVYVLWTWTRVGSICTRYS